MADGESRREDFRSIFPATWLEQACRMHERHTARPRLPQAFI